MTTIASSWMKSPDCGIPSAGAVADPPAEALRLFNEHGGAIYRFCRSMLRDESEAEDVVQETFLKLLQHLKADSVRSNIRSWLFTVAANACRDRMRWRMRWLPWSEEEDQRTVPPSEDDEDRRRARATLRQLAPRDRMLLSLRANGLSYREIAVATGIREQSVGRLLARAVDRWKRAVDRRLV